MHIEIVDNVGYSHIIDTDDPDLAGKWFVRKAKQLMTTDTRLSECRVRIWPSNEAESKTIGQWENKLTENNLLDFASHILAVSGELGKFTQG